MREKAIKSAEEKLGEPIEVMDFFFQSAPADARPLWFLGKNLELLSAADVAVGMQESENYEGGLYEYMKTKYGYAYTISSFVVFKLIPYF